MTREAQVVSGAQVNKMTIKQEIKRFKQLTQQMSETFANKRSDYGQTTTETYDRYGPASLLIRMYDKLGRLDNLLGKQQMKVKEESVYDTLLDLANYAIIAIIELEKRK